jgi:hypothetical protein
VTLPRFRFSLATLLLVVMWSAVVLWINTTTPDAENVSEAYLVVHYHGWPWVYAWRECLTPARNAEDASMLIESYWALAGDAFVGVLLVASLTWVSRFLVRRAGFLNRLA